MSTQTAQVFGCSFYSAVQCWHISTVVEIIGNAGRRFLMLVISALLCLFIWCVLSKIYKFVHYLFVIGIMSLKHNKLAAFYCATNACSFHRISNLCEMYYTLLVCRFLVCLKYLCILPLFCIITHSLNLMRGWITYSCRIAMLLNWFF